MDSFLPPPSPPPLETVELPESARIAQGANPTPVHNHPPYPEMITAAVAALKEPNGSSKQSIARYIEQSYSDLPPTHSSLLTLHLKQLKNMGQLVMVKHSYKLPGSPTQQQQQQPLQMEIEGNGAPVAGTKRKPGRPPKLKPEAQLQQDSQPTEFQPEMEFHQDPLFQFQPDPISQNQFQLQDPDPLQFHQEAQFEVQPFAVQDSQNVTAMEPESVFASLGLVDAPPLLLPQKKGPGRPRKISSEDKSPAPQSLPSLVKRGPGRPPKGGLATATSSGRPRGRPKRSINSALTGPPSATIAKKVGVSGRPRGRPKKNAPHFGSATGGSAINVPINYSNGTAVTTNASPPFAAAGALNGGVLPSMSKRRGRPPRSSTQLPASSSEGMAPPPPRPRGRPPRSSYTAGGYNKSRKLSGRPPGRPRKNAPLVAPIASSSHHSALQGEHEQLKSMIKETARVIRPFLTDEAALAALQNLEASAANDVNPVS